MTRCIVTLRFLNCGPDLVHGLSGDTRRGTKQMAKLKLSKAGLAEDALKSATYHQGLCEINLLGDPSLPVR